MKRVLLIMLLFGAQRLQAQWVQTNFPNSNGIIYSSVVSGTSLFVGGSGVYLSTDNGTSWKAAGLQNYTVNALAVSGTNLFAGTNAGVFRSTDNGTSWTSASAGITYSIVNALVVSGTNLFAGTGDGGFLSTNNGTSWSYVIYANPNINIRALVAYGMNNILASTSRGFYLSTNNGTSWNRSTFQNDESNALAVSKTNIFAGRGNIAATNNNGGMFLSINDGKNWGPVGLQNYTVNALAVYGTNLFAGTGIIYAPQTYGGVYLSTDNGTSWINTGIINTVVTTLAISGTDLFAGTYRIGVWRRPLSEMVTGVKNNFTQVPVDFMLEQNYPNPFNPATTIRYQLPKTTQVVLKIYNVFGQEVRTLVKAWQTAGVNAVVWDGRDESGNEVSSGIYVYRLQAGDAVQSRKLSFVK